MCTVKANVQFEIFKKHLNNSKGTNITRSYKLEGKDAIGKDHMFSWVVFDKFFYLIIEYKFM